MRDLKKYKALVDFVKENDDFVITDTKLFCTPCNEEKFYDSREGVKPLKEHLKTRKHAKSKPKQEERGVKQTRLDFNVIGGSAKGFDFELVEMMVATNTPLFRIDDPFFCDFIQKHTAKKLKSSPIIERKC